MRTGAALGVREHYNLALQEPEGHQPLLVVGAADILASNREVVLNRFGTSEVKAVTSYIFTALTFVPRCHNVIVITICSLGNRGATKDVTEGG